MTFRGHCVSKLSNDDIVGSRLDENDYLLSIYAYVFYYFDTCIWTHCSAQTYVYTYPQSQAYS